MQARLHSIHGGIVTSTTVMLRPWMQALNFTRHFRLNEALSSAIISASNLAAVPLLVLFSLAAGTCNLTAPPVSAAAASQAAAAAAATAAAVSTAAASAAAAPLADAAAVASQAVAEIAPQVLAAASHNTLLPMVAFCAAAVCSLAAGVAVTQNTHGEDKQVRMVYCGAAPAAATAGAAPPSTSSSRNPASSSGRSNQPGSSGSSSSGSSKHKEGGGGIKPQAFGSQAQQSPGAASCVVRRSRASVCGAGLGHPVAALSVAMRGMGPLRPQLRQAGRVARAAAARVVGV